MTVYGVLYLQFVCLVPVLVSGYIYLVCNVGDVGNILSLF